MAGRRRGISSQLKKSDFGSLGATAGSLSSSGTFFQQAVRPKQTGACFFLVLAHRSQYVRPNSDHLFRGETEEIEQWNEKSEWGRNREETVAVAGTEKRRR